jgi:hypothetical protein
MRRGPGSRCFLRRAAYVELDKPAAIRLGFVPTVVLEGCENISVGQADIGVRVHVSVQIAERRDERRVLWLAQVEQHGAPALKCIGEKKAALRHLQFRVMGRSTRAGDCDRSDHLAVVRRCGIGVQYCEEIVALFRIVARPDEQAGIALGVSANGGEQQKDEAAEIAHRHKLLPRKRGCVNRT